jgi:hypothetical protein
MLRINLKQVIVILVCGLIGWALCGAIMFVGMAVTSIQTTLILHAIGAPIIFSAISWIYSNKFNYTTSLQTAIIFLMIVLFMDFFLVGLIINRSLEMFTSLLGTWIPFILIFLSTYLIGLAVEVQARRSRVT